MKLSKYNKLWAALAAAAGVLVLVAAPDAEAGQQAFELTRNELYSILVTFAGALGVYQFKNRK
jgi:hypothetical protein